MNKFKVGLAILIASHCLAPVFGQQTLLLKQERDGVPAQNLTAAEFGTLGDPFFELVLRNNAQVTDLAQIENLIQPNVANRQTFVVDENIRSNRRNEQRRAVLSYTGSNAGHVLDTNVMISVAFSSEDFPDAQRFIESWGWDNARGRYNYYKLDRAGTPDQRLSWKFRGSSVDADLLSSADREGTCMACHINGAPIMKELAFPWNNWHSFASIADYLTTGAPTTTRWPVSTNPRIAERLRGAEELETGGILPSITQFNNRRINLLLARSDADGNLALQNGRATVLDGRRLLRSLFVTTEVNLISARQKSGLHPFPKASTAGPAVEVEIPSTFFLNANIMAGGSAAQFEGVGSSTAQGFRGVRLTATEYRQFVVSNGLSLMGREPADADFAWFAPEASHIDNDMIDRLIRRGIISKDFAAAVLLVDLETPVFSDARASLLRFVPQMFTFQPAAPGAPTASSHPDELTAAVISNIKAAGGALDPAVAFFLTALQNPSPRQLLEQGIAAYTSRIAGLLKNPQTRKQELSRLFDRLLESRARFLRHELLAPLDETGNRLLPMPSTIEIRPTTGSGGQIK